MAFDNPDTPGEKAEDLNFHTDMPVGEILRRTRVYYGQTLQQIEVVLRIRASHLEALEQGDVSKLPGRVYAIGFVRSYSEYLGLDGDKMVHLFKVQSVGKKAKPDLSFPAPASESKVPNPAIIGASLFGFIVLIGFLAMMFLPGREQNEIPPVPDALTKSRLNQAPALVNDGGETGQISGSPASGGEPGVAPSSETAATAPVPENRIVLEITDASWIEIWNASGDSILRQVLKAGDRYKVPNERGLIMTTGNAGGIKLVVDGKPLPQLGEQGQIKRKVALDPDLLLRAKVR